MLVTRLSKTGTFTIAGEFDEVTNSPFSPANTNYAALFNGSTDNVKYTQQEFSSVFTIEFWIYPASNSGNTYLYAVANTGPLITLTSSFYIQLTQQGGTPYITSSILTPSNTWSHVAIVRTSATGSNTTSIYINGVLGALSALNSTFPGSQTAYIGSTNNPNQFFSGYLSNFRIVNGTAIYTSNFTVPTARLLPVYTIVATTPVEYLVVAGGGGGGGYYGGGGGAGGYLTASGFSVASNTAITVTVGGGGGSATFAQGGLGNPSAFSTITTTGGGGGGYYGKSGSAGGSGGGSGGNDNSGACLGGAASPAGQGNPGAAWASFGGSSGIYGSGGGGAGGAGSNAQNGSGGGAGVVWVDGVTYAGGGGGTSDPGGPGGTGGGGRGGNRLSGGSYIGPTSGTSGLGGGGGGTAGTSQASGSGGDGIVIVRYSTAYAAATSYTNGSYAIVGSYRVYTWLTSGSLTLPTSSINITSLLTLQDSTFIDNSGNSLAITTSGTPTMQVAYPFITNFKLATTYANVFAARFDEVTLAPSNVLAGIPAAIQYLLIGGGGGGAGGKVGDWESGGGGAGGVLTGSLVPGYTALALTVGSGGAGAASQGTQGTSGSNSILGSLTSYGGGGGASASINAGLSGGSGGGSNVAGAGGAGTVGQGNAGYGAVGGGGGGGAGAAATTTTGGAGVVNEIAGSTIGQQVLLLNQITIDYLVVGGGGGGGTGGGSLGADYTGGGGGAGGFLSGTTVPTTTYTISVGGGGGGGYNPYTSPAGGSGGNGNNSFISGVATATGGGYGGAYGDGTGGSGGSGGGAGRDAGAAGTGVVGQGKNGGTSGGGGGGASSVGDTGTSSSNGGSGSNWNGNTYAGGGGGGGIAGPRSGGGGGGGQGYNPHRVSSGSVDSDGGPGTLGTGGGGGASGCTRSGGNGGGGIVIIRYTSAYAPAITTNLAAGYPQVSGGYRTYAWTTAGTITFPAATYYVGGGGAASFGTGGSGGGGTSTSSLSSPGTPYTGGGGAGGTSTNSMPGGAGGSGAAIITYASTYAKLIIPDTLTYTFSTTANPGYYLYTFTAGTGALLWPNSGSISAPWAPVKKEIRYIANGQTYTELWTAGELNEFTPPIVTITASSYSLVAYETATLTFTLSEDSTTFTSSDVAVTGGILSGFTGSGTVYTALFTPTAQSTTPCVVTIAAGSFFGTVGDTNPAATATITINTVVPTMPASVQYLIVAGGGGGGSGKTPKYDGNGGNGGGVLTGTITTATTMTITVGIGGTANTVGNSGNSGGNSSISSTTASGGGGGGITTQGVAQGGDGAGGSHSGKVGGVGAVNPITLSTTGQLSGGSYYVSGGGGAPSTTYVTNTSWSGQGGDSYLTGSQSLITGVAFTFECWVYTIGSPSGYYLIGNDTGPLIGYNGSTFAFAHQGGFSVSSSNPPQNQWAHIAVTRDASSNVVMYVNGSASGSGNDSSSFTGAQTYNIDGASNHYISNMRIVNGSVVYTGNFTPPTSALSSISGTTLLTFQGSVPGGTLQGNAHVSVSSGPFAVGTAGTGGAGGLGGGAAAGTNAGLVNTGGGGGGGSAVTSTIGGAGGSGVVVISYPTSSLAATSYTNGTYQILGSNRVYTWTTSGSITF